ncbi:MAG: enoyl-CoA hydratase-related protein [Nitrospirota bacterium]
MAGLVSVERVNGVTHVIMNSPPANALSPRLMELLGEIVTQLETDTESRAVVFRTALEKIFMAGADLKHLMSLNEQGFRNYVNIGQRLNNRIEALPKPTIAVLSGHALGGGLEFSLACDFRYMAAVKAMVGVPEVGLGLLPGGGGTQRLVRQVGRSKAVEMLITGKPLQGPDALAIGLVDRIFPPDQLLAESTKFAETLAQGATEAIARIKRCLRIPRQHLMLNGLAEELDGIIHLFVNTQDCKEGIAAFNEKRPPKYEGK